MANTRSPDKPTLEAEMLTGRQQEIWDYLVDYVDQHGYPPTVREIPLVGQIAAGGPLLADQNVEDHLAVPETLRGDFLLRVKGDSMVNAGILDGDIVVVQRSQDARNGEIVVALAGDDESADEATVKRFFREKGRVRLQPENDALEPIYAQHVQILGRVTGVFREL